MQTVWKYAIPMSSEFTLQMPRGAKPLTVQTQQGAPMMWALVDDAAPMVEHRFALVGTGHPIDYADRYLGSFQYLGTFQAAGGQLVWHLFLRH